MSFCAFALVKTFIFFSNFNAENEDLVCQRTLEDFFDVISPREEIMIDKFNLFFSEI